MGPLLPAHPHLPALLDALIQKLIAGIMTSLKASQR